MQKTNQIKNVELTGIAPSLVYGCDQVPAIAEFVQVRSRGVPMVPEYELLSVSLGDFIFAATGNTITLTDPGIGTFAKYIPGQFIPSRLGQRIEIFDATNAANRGIFRVAIDGVSPDGLVLTVADRLVVNETAPAGTRIESYEQDVQYNPFTGVFRSPPRGVITGDILFDPALGPGSAQPKVQLPEELATSVPTDFEAAVNTLRANSKAFAAERTA